ncbi:MAG: CDP-glucose 4,6-dehydratase [Terrimicrobiaceae bacterium]
MRQWHGTVEGLVMDFLAGDTYRGKKVFVTGHTGFKGAWLCEWLLALGADVTGFSLPDLPTEPSLFSQLGLASRMRELRGDVRDLPALEQAWQKAQPEFVFHLAAQPLVLASYRDPLATLQTNLLGTANLLEISRKWDALCGMVIVATDKCYENREWVYAYREIDGLGGRDVYSASKACVEVITAAWRQSFFAGHPVRIATARAGNVIGGGDWAENRIVPDAMRALACGEKLAVRNPHSQRPWQHVLEPLHGYLTLAAALRMDERDSLHSAFNFGPEPGANRTVEDLVREITRHWPGIWEAEENVQAPHEARMLQLAIEKARHMLDWKPRWNFATTVEKTVHWYRKANGDSARAGELTRDDIAAYCAQN